MTRTHTLVLSFSGLVDQVMAGSIGDADLHGAIYYLGCTRTHVVADDRAMAELSLSSDNELQQQVTDQLRDAIMAAEEQGRAAYRTPNQNCSFEELNELLASNGLPAILPTDSDPEYYNVRKVHEAVRQQDLPYRVFSTAIERA